MPVTTDLSRKPYHDDYDPVKNYYRVLYKPGVSIQARELNEVQSVLQTQIERLGDNLFSKGTIVSGCNFVFYEDYKYVKIRDTDEDGVVTSPAGYENLSLVDDSTGLKATVLTTRDGYETSPPNLKTLYLKYVNTGTSSNSYSFEPGTTLRVVNPVYSPLERVLVTDGGSGFSNGQIAFAIPKVAVSATTGTIANGEYVTNGLGANLQVTRVDANTLASSNLILLSLKPRNEDLANAQSNGISWNLSNNDVIRNVANTATALVTRCYGEGYVGEVVTDAVGKIVTVVSLDRGHGYNYAPHVTVRSIGNETGYDSLDLDGRNYVAKVKVSAGANSVGSGYAFGVTEGVVWQKGAALRVVPQTVVVEPYSVSPDGVSVGFSTIETIVTSDVDTDLLDNASESDNYAAPGADRLQLVPVLVVSNTASAAANSDFFSICDWKEGQPYRQNQQTIYSTIGDAMATRVRESSGDFVVDPFLVTTRSSATGSSNTIDVVIDPGVAYVDGYRVATAKNFSLPIDKAYSYQTKNDHSVSLTYGNYVLVNELSGAFDVRTGATVYFYDSPRQYLTNSACVKAQNTTPNGNLIGNATIRCLTLDSGTPGTPSAQYRAYVFNTKMSPGKSFAQVRSLYSNTGIADAVLQTASNGASVASISESNNSYMMFPTRLEALRSVSDLSYTFRTSSNGALVSNGGVVTYNLGGASGETFTYTGNLSSSQERELYVAPTNVDLLFSSNVTGAVAISSSSNVVTGTGTAFLTDLAAGDYVYAWTNTTFYDVRRIEAVVNDTSVRIDSNASSTNAATALTRVFPKNVPVPFGYRSGLSGNVSANGTVLTLDFGSSFQTVNAQPVSIVHDVLASGAAQTTKTANRHAFVKLCLANNAGNTTGPWCLGVPDVFRLRNVWVGNSTVSNTGTARTDSFVVDHNQTTDFLDLSWLVKNPNSPVTLANTDYLLVEFDYFTGSGAGPYDTVSYVGSNTEAVLTRDSLPLSSLGTTASTLEIPEIYTYDGTCVDLTQAFDFRPSAANTVAPSSTPGGAPINPADSYSIGTGAKKFPTPGKLLTADVTYYAGRADSVLVSETGEIRIATGNPAADPYRRVPPAAPAGTMLVSQLNVPPYPTLPVTRSVALEEIVNTRVTNQRKLSSRIERTTVTPVSSVSRLPYQQPRGYSMSDIASLDRRLQAVEYQVALSGLEANVANMTIPSGTDPSTNRYKYGYFADDFSSTVLSDFGDPQYSVTKEGNDLVPSKLLFDIALTDGIGSLPFIEETIVRQENATQGSLVDANTRPVCGLGLANTVAYATIFRNWTDGITTYSPNSNTTVDVVDVTFADLAHIEEYYAASVGTSPFYNANDPTAAWGRPNTIVGQAIEEILAVQNKGVAFVHAVRRREINIDTIVGTGGTGDLWTFYPAAEAPPVVLYHYCYDQPTLIEIYQGNTVIASSANSVALDQTEIALLTGDGAGAWFDDQQTLYMRDPVQTGNGYVTYAGKITFNYSYAGGNEFHVRTTSLSADKRWKPWRWVMSYPINGSSVGCVPPVAEWTQIMWHCTNGVGSPGAFSPVTHGLYGITAATQTYDINQLWAGGANSVIATGVALTTTQQLKVGNVTHVVWHH